MPVCTELPRVANESLIPEVGPHDPAAVLTTRVEWALGDSSGPFEQEYLVRWKNEVRAGRVRGVRCEKKKRGHTCPALSFAPSPAPLLPAL